MGLNAILLKAVEAAGMATPKPIQAQAIPAQLAGQDILGIAQTGSGKTAAFALPILQKIITIGDKRKGKTARALVLAPTRELAVQIEETFRTLAKGAHISTALVLGGVSRIAQINKMQAGVDVLIATPGRLTDLVRDNRVDLSETRWLVLDEADRMLDMGFINDVKRIAKGTHRDRQTALFSATMPQEVATLAATLLRNPVRVEVAPQGTTAAEIKQVVHMIPTKQKKQVLSAMLKDETLASVIVFTRTKHGADAVTRVLEKDGYDVAAIHGNKSQNARQRALNGFKDGSVRVLVATDIAARGIDVVGISHVINFDLPDEPESYVHRIGRTGRNGASGSAITLYDPAEESSKLKAVERVTRMRLPMHDSPIDLSSLPARAANSDQRPPRREGGTGAPGKKPHRGQSAGSGKPREARGEKIWSNDGGAPAQKRPFRRNKRKSFGAKAA
ncbi:MULTISPECIES: DEAD/DEAH box helicase [Phyllobacterium]|uniref:RNA helicase n=1 Tax=Phyllobacterium sophorae TaxID=1520277 RepID=A0A2P7BJ63_9HYPH|nr:MULTISPECIES: DEAD/DEAH box helicase [Phyllobacterium]PSH66496.1 RNA helicase [Phyllobacterium sophorae]UXN65954.1 DEAD/DEAH box helicase [Phyllobacterium sp. A18/5-2]